MKKTIFYILLLLLILRNILIAQTTYYISNIGDDNNNGTSPSTPWRSLSHINKMSFNPGDSILLRAGDVWREELTIDCSGSYDNYIVFSRYGSGNNPMILGSNAASFSEQGIINIWRSNETFSNPRISNSSNHPSQIFFIDENDSVSWGNFKEYTSDFSNLSNNLDWTWYNNIIYIFYNSDPSQAFSSIEIPQRETCIKLEYETHPVSSNYICLDGIDLHYAKSKGFYSGYPAVRGITGLTYRNSNIAYIGEKNGSSAYGITGFQSNFLVENCSFSDCGRRAISFNLYLNRENIEDKRYITNVVVRNNIFKRGWHTTSLDCASTGDHENFYHADTIIGIYFYNNIVDDSELTPDCADMRSNQVFFQEGGAYFNDIYVFNNVFIQASGRNILIENGDTAYVWNNTVVGHNPNTFVASTYSNISFNFVRFVDFRNNIMYSNWPNNGQDDWGVLMQHTPSVYIECDYNLYYQEFEDPNHNGFTGGLHGYFTISNWNSYRSRNPELDPHSPHPADPQFLVLYKDLHLSPTSPAKNSGIQLRHSFIDPEGNIIVVGTFDIDGLPRPLNPSIGAYEFIDPDISQAYIISFAIPGQLSSIIDNQNSTISIIMPAGTGITNLTPSIIVCYGATINPASGIIQDFTSPVNYVVTSGDGTNQKTYVVTVSTETKPPPGLPEENPRISISPNPASDNVEISIIGDAPSESFYARIFTLPGNIVYKSSTYNGNSSITLPVIKSLEVGTYIIELVFDNYQTLAEKLIISR